MHILGPCLNCLDFHIGFFKCRWKYPFWILIIIRESLFSTDSSFPVFLFSDNLVVISDFYSHIKWSIPSGSISSAAHAQILGCDTFARGLIIGSAGPKFRYRQIRCSGTFASFSEIHGLKVNNIFSRCSQS